METLKLRKWNDLTEEVKAPQTVTIALASARPELLKLAPKGAATEEETAALYNVIRVLMETNMELQRHSQYLAQRMHDLRGNLRGIVNKFDELRNLANFTEADDDDMEVQA